jgi:hypothetical protein
MYAPWTAFREGPNMLVIDPDGVPRLRRVHPGVLRSNAI